MAEEGIGRTIEFARHAAAFHQKPHQNEHRQDRQRVEFVIIDDKPRRTGNGGAFGRHKRKADTTNKTKREAKRHPQEGQEQKNTKSDE